MDSQLTEIGAIVRAFSAWAQTSRVCAVAANQGQPDLRWRSSRLPRAAPRKGSAWFQVQIDREAAFSRICAAVSRLALSLLQSMRPVWGGLLPMILIRRDLAKSRRADRHRIQDPEAPHHVESAPRFRVASGSRWFKIASRSHFPSCSRGCVAGRVCSASPRLVRSDPGSQHSAMPVPRDPILLRHPDVFTARVGRAPTVRRELRPIARRALTETRRAYCRQARKKVTNSPIFCFQYFAARCIFRLA